MGTMNHLTTLCLACACSLPPRTSSTPFLTRCCHRPICHQCLSANPRLARYDPCLRCLSGVRATARNQLVAGHAVNVDGEVRDDDVFMLGDDDEDIDEEDDEVDDVAPPPPYDDDLPASPAPDRPPPADCAPAAAATPLRYHIQPDDTLLGIALRLHVDGHTLCRLNGLPPSTLRTTPHLLHTRSSLILPPSATSHLPTSNTPPAQREAARVAARLQAVTKEPDWHVARAYVALADIDEPDGDDVNNFHSKDGDGKSRAMSDDKPVLGVSVADRAVSRYLADAQWEAAHPHPHSAVGRASGHW